MEVSFWALVRVLARASMFLVAVVMTRREEVMSGCGWVGVVLGFLWVRFGVLSGFWGWSGVVLLVDFVGFGRAIGVVVFPLEVCGVLGEDWVRWVGVFFSWVLISLRREVMVLSLSWVVTWCEPWLSWTIVNVCWVWVMFVFVVVLRSVSIDRWCWMFLLTTSTKVFRSAMSSVSFWGSRTWGLGFSGKV